MNKYYIYENDIPEDFPISASVAIDTESMGLINRRDRLCLVQLSVGDGAAHLVKFNGKDYSAPRLKDLLLDSCVTKIFHFGRFDIAILRHYIGALTINCYCTKIASRLARTYTDHHSLKELCSELLGVKLNKGKQSSDWGASSLSREQMSYAASDVLYLHAIKEALDGMLKRENRFKLAEACFQFLPYRAELDLLGWEAQDIFSHKIQ
ncbi:3'-5' exonuclease family protein [Neorickettsia helminthoeca str. Oregon]|uniref:3'-5' exonuclease family protein n=1 Tax=Neorickettsia helminthoeca str. Oregon TaxID=1286528 RepID=X5HK62_9RICK|nr:3'-5' exonuclease [Neorickettsia helminthoeca]AHX11449.1 3'-5' exonuclease family protein [Neorickettsia helminthoeca str. Oregon]